MGGFPVYVNDMQICKIWKIWIHHGFPVYPSKVQIRKTGKIWIHQTVELRVVGPLADYNNDILQTRQKTQEFELPLQLI